MANTIVVSPCLAMVLFDMLLPTSYHPDWQMARVKFILDRYPAGYFDGKRILELAPFNGYIGACFAERGAKVHCVEGREENVIRIRSDYCRLTVEQGNLDVPTWDWGDWDIILNFGLFYHLERYHREHLLNCLAHCKLMFFESVVYDSTEDELFFTREIGSDQSLSNKGGNPSTSFVENVLSSVGAGFEKISSKQLNGNDHVYDWPDTGAKVFHPRSRRFWIIIPALETKHV